MGTRQGTPWGRATGRAKGRAARRFRGTRHGRRHGTCQGTCQVAMLSVSILMYRAEGYAVSGRPGHVKPSVSLKTFSTHLHARHPPGQPGH
eukprot:330838-Pyramimonas_sp.AAC.1